MELAEYNSMLVPIGGKNNVFAHAFSKLKTLNIYKEPLENPKSQVVSSTQEIVTEICATNIHTI